MPSSEKLIKGFTWFGERIFIQKGWHLIDKVSLSLNIFLSIFLIFCCCVFRCSTFQVNLSWHIFLFQKKKPKKQNNSVRAESLTFLSSLWFSFSGQHLVPKSFLVQPLLTSSFYFTGGIPSWGWWTDTVLEHQGSRPQLPALFFNRVSYSTA